MSDELPTVWPIEPHTAVKHKILRKYLQMWLPILSLQGSREILFVDGFAGPGKYQGDEDGSPVIALKVALTHNKPLPTPIRMLLIEIYEARFRHLESTIGPLREKASLSQSFRAVEVLHGECDSTLQGRMSEFERMHTGFGPALVFLDQFGYGAVSMALIKQILSFPRCEVFTYLGYKAMNRWIGDPAKADTFTRAFGGDEWKECISLNEKERRDRLLTLYKIALTNRAGAKYVVSFLMFDQNGVPLYWLLFCTNHLRGLEQMKAAMWDANDTGGFRFSDRDDPAQLPLLSEKYDDDWLADELSSRLNGKTMTAYEVKEYVLVETPCYLFKGALKSLESDDVAKIVGAPVGRKAGKFNNKYLNDIRIRFEKGLF